MSIRPISKELQKKAEEELNEVPGRLQEDLQHIRDWLAKQPHLNIRDDDQWITAFLRGCKFSLEQTKDKIDYFHTMRTLLPEMYSNRDPLSDQLQTLLKENIFMLLPNPDPAGPAIMLFKWGACNHETMSIEAIAKCFFITMDILMKEDDNAIIAGMLCVIDLRGLSKRTAMQWTPSYMQKTLMCFQGKYPIRVKGLHYINAPALFSAVHAVAITFLKEKIRKRTSVSTEGNLNDFYKIVPLSVLPKDYGGNSGSVAELAGALKKRIESLREWFLEDVKYRSDESLRPGKPKTSTDVFGVEGSFRKLNID